MGLLGGGGKKVKPQYTGLDTNTSTGILPFPIVYGSQRCGVNAFWYGDFTAHKVKAGKGGGKGASSYTYSASLMLALSEGPISGVGNAWRDKDWYSTYTKLGFSLFTGTYPQSPWGYLTANHPTEALSYPGIAYLAKANYDLGAANSVGNLNFEVHGVLYATAINGGAPDADPALMVQDFLTNTHYGVGFPSSQLDSTYLLSGPNAGTTGDSAYQTYCRAMGFGLSPNLEEQKAASDIVSQWALLTNSAVVWTGYTLRLVPYSEQTIAGNGVTWLPNVTSQYTIDASVWAIGDNTSDPVQMQRSDPADVMNEQKLTFRDRSNQYVDTPVEWKDQNSIETLGLRADSAITAPEICTGTMALTVLALIGQRKVYIRNTYNTSLPVNFCRLEPMDVFTIVDDGVTYVLRVTDIEEKDETTGEIQITAEEFTGTVSTTGSYSVQANSNSAPNTGSDPGSINTPILWEPPSDLTNGIAEAWAAVSGASQYWGGCNVWVSTDNITYSEIGEIVNPARMGLLTTGLAAYGGANPDATNTLGVNLTESFGELNSTTATEAARDGNLCYVDGEYLTFETATLTSAYHYSLTQMWRGLHGSSAGAHLTGTAFARLDDTIFKYQLPAAYIGQTLYFKFQSFNLWGNAEQDLSTCTAYTLVPTGAGFGGGTGGVPKTPTGLAVVASGNGLTASWAANASTDNVTQYEVWRAPGPAGAFGSATKIATVAGLTYTDMAVTTGQTYTYFLKADNVIGASTQTAGVDGTVTSSGVGPVALGFQRLTTGVVVSDVLASWDVGIAYTLKAGLSGSQFKLEGETPVAPSSNTTFGIEVAGVNVGSVTINAGAFTGTFTMAADHAVSSGTVVRIISPSNINGMSGVLTGSLQGIR